MPNNFPLKIIDRIKKVLLIILIANMQFNIIVSEGFQYIFNIIGVICGNYILKNI